MWPLKRDILDGRNLLYHLKSFSVAFLQNPDHQVVQDPCDVLLCELRNLKWSLGALLTSLGKDPHLHLASALPSTPVHVEKDLDMGRGPTARAGGAPEPAEGPQLVLHPALLQDVGKKPLVWCEGPFVPWFHLLY